MENSTLSVSLFQSGRKDTILDRCSCLEPFRKRTPTLFLFLCTFSLITHQRSRWFVVVQQIGREGDQQTVSLQIILGPACTMRLGLLAYRLCASHLHLVH